MSFGPFGKLSPFPLLVVVPIVIDALSVLLGTTIHGYQGSPHLTFKLALQMGLPSIGAVTEQGFMPGSVQLPGGGGIHAASLLGVLLYLALYLAVQSFLQGGYVGLLCDASNGRKLSMAQFAAYGRRFFFRFLLLNIVVFAFLFIVGAIFTLILMVPGMILFFVLFLVLRVLFLYLEFTMVAEDCSLSEAFSRSRAYFRSRTPSTLPLVGAAVLVNVIAGLVVNALWLPFLFLVWLIVYDAVMARLQLAFMEDFRRIRG
ncbi:hypothetical protein [Paenibacillus humicola]|uniref:hypothetical protein n=1 Tax=Paenibacillus humicola TaxID=3110540 RepID=UPI00237C2E0D|nr:hypothetical protein [Paenibacillus humicola]